MSPRAGPTRSRTRGLSQVVGSSRTNVPARPRETTRPVRRSACHAALTVAGETPSSAATSRTVGSRSPGASAPARIARLKAPAMPRGERSSTGPHTGVPACDAATIGTVLIEWVTHGRTKKSCSDP